MFAVLIRRTIRKLRGCGGVEEVGLQLSHGDSPVGYDARSGRKPAWGAPGASQ